MELEGDPDDLKQPLIVLNREDVERETGLTVEDAVITAPENGVAKLIVTNCSGFTQSVPRGTYLGEAEVAEVLATVEPDKNEPSSAEAVTVKRTTFSSEAWRREKLMETLELPDLPPPDLRLLREFLADHHDVFSLEDGERGETDLMDMEIDTGDASPRKQAPRRMPFVVREADQGYAVKPSHPAIPFAMVQSCRHGQKERWVPPLLCRLQRPECCH